MLVSTVKLILVCQALLSHRCRAIQSKASIASLDQNSTHGFTELTRHDIIGATNLGAKTGVLSDSNYSTIADPNSQVDEWNPFLMYWTLHCALAFVAGIGSIYFPKVTLGIILLPGLVFVYSYAWGIPLWVKQPLSVDWWFLFAKWIIVDLTASTVILMLALKPSTANQTKFGVFAHIVVAINICWAVLIPAPLLRDKVNNATSAVLIVALAVHCVAVNRRGLPLLTFDKSAGVVYNHGISLPWCACYSVWNALMVASLFGLDTTLQIFLHLCVMAELWYLASEAKPFEDYWIQARAVNLSVYMNVCLTCGTFFGQSDYWKANAPPSPLLDGHPFYFFLSIANLTYGLMVLRWSAISLLNMDTPLRKLDG